jgi:protein-tyrosine phosphatase
MIDLHFHCLPGIDDGPSTWDEAVELCRAAAAEGTETIVATPHVLRDQWLNDDPAVRDRLILRLNSLLGGRPAIVPGCEYYFAADAVELWERGSAGPLVALNRGTALLIEFPAYAVPAQADSVFHELSILGVTPVIAHPERNIELAQNPDRLAQLVARGALAQLTAGSLLGEFGRNALAAAESFFARRLIHFVASDAHSLARRPPRLAAARQWVGKRWGKAAEADLFDKNPAAVIQRPAVAMTHDRSAKQW